MHKKYVMITYMSYIQFKKDLKLGQLFENEFIKILEKKNYQIISTCNDNKYDIEASRKNKLVTFEVKADLMSDKTGNYFIEFISFNKPSGINTTQADFYVLYNDNKFNVVSVQLIKEMIEDKDYKRILCNSNKTSMGYIFDCKLVNKYYTWIAGINLSEILETG
jgi:hypothetical protein